MATSGREIDETTKQRIRDLAARTSLSRRELAKESGVSVPTVQKILKK